MRETARVPRRSSSRWRCGSPTTGRKTTSQQYIRTALSQWQTNATHPGQSWLELDCRPTFRDSTLNAQPPQAGPGIRPLPRCNPQQQQHRGCNRHQRSFYLDPTATNRPRHQLRNLLGRQVLNDALNVMPERYSSRIRNGKLIQCANDQLALNRVAGSLTQFRNVKQHLVDNSIDSRWNCDAYKLVNQGRLMNQEEFVLPPDPPADTEAVPMQLFWYTLDWDEDSNALIPPTAKQMGVPNPGVGPGHDNTTPPPKLLEITLYYPCSLPHNTTLRTLSPLPCIFKSGGPNSATIINDSVIKRSHKSEPDARCTLKTCVPILTLTMVIPSTPESQWLCILSS